MNDRIVIRDNRYIINSYTTDLTSGEANFELINDYRALNYNSVGYKYANIESLYVDNTEQEIQIDLFLGMFKQFTITALSGFISSPTSGVFYEDTSLTMTIAANASGVLRTNSISVKFKDFDNVETIIDIQITQDL